MTDALTRTGPMTKTVEVPGASLAYDIREPETRSTAPTLVLVGSPMGASGFTTLAGHFRDRRVVTYDPRGVSRSKRTDRAKDPTPDDHADDIHRVISAIGGGPVDLFASSGGAVNALALVARHPEQVRTLVAHEPPAAQVLPDRREAQASAVAIRKTYERDGIGPAMAKFMALTGLTGPVPAEFADQPPPDPAAFGLPTADDGSRDDALMANMITCTHYQPDFDALRRASTRIVLAVGAESEGQLAYRGGVAVAERLGTKAVTFPSHHGGFLGGEFGWAGQPEAFAAKLREVLSEKS
jgi:pimeloyl-ACP methyl ester carboxylesterase